MYIEVNRENLTEKELNSLFPIRKDLYYDTIILEQTYYKDFHTGDVIEYTIALDHDNSIKKKLKEQIDGWNSALSILSSLR